jgi:hypothetical protein
MRVTMIKSIRGEFVAYCENNEECDGEFPGGTESNFFKFIEQLKKAGWTIRKRDDEWCHFCPDCRADR